MSNTIQVENKWSEIANVPKWKYSDTYLPPVDRSSFFLRMQFLGHKEGANGYCLQSGMEQCEGCFGKQKSYWAQQLNIQ